MSPSTPPPVPSALRPIFLVGAGSIVRDAHLPAYRQVGYRVAGVFDLDRARASEVAATAGAKAYGSLAALVEAAEADGGVYDLALPPSAVPATLEVLPEGAFVLLQKPFGRDLAEATQLLALTRARRLRGAVNYQLRYAPAVEAARALLAYGAIGELIDLELRVVCRMPWETWPFLAGMPRMEVLMHAIHYLDLARSFLGEPERVWCGTARQPSRVASPHTAPDAREQPCLAETRSTTVLSFGETRRAVVTTYHHHAAPAGHDASHLRLEGTGGTMVARLGVNLDYPRGRDDTLELSRNGGAWERVPLRGNWFPHGFEGPMRSLQRLAAGDVARIHSGFDDAWRTMALVETCYKSAEGGERVPEPPADA